jgi:tRNA-2-methylthio-N6-dimethylallyladenosine synthase
MQSRTTKHHEGNPGFMGQGFKEITLWDKTLTVTWYGGGLKRFRGRYRNAKNYCRFRSITEMTAVSFPKMRIRFSTSNPQDMHESVLHVIAKHPNICKHIHLPVQSGSNRILKEMNRLHSREEYMIDKIRAIIRTARFHKI